jgi:Tol biopolymer transport system component
MPRRKGRKSRAPLALAVAALSAFGLSLGCAGVFAPRFPQDIATALAQERMSRLETPDIYLYYPTRRRDEALRFLERVGACAAHWQHESWLHNHIADAKMVLVMPEVPYNNAFIAPQAAGYEAVGVVPSYNTVDFFTVEAGLPPDPSFIGCHEITHYVHFEQMGGFAWFMNTVFGDVYSPQAGLDHWFDEGLAVYSETTLQPGAGRLAWPLWNGIFAAGVAGKKINGGDLSEFNRVFDGGNHYLFGSQFVRFLAERYGEERLWKFIEVQGRSIFFPLWINVRFWQAYDKSLSTLIDEFAADTAARFPPVARPPDQRVVRDAGTNARYARAADGTEAIITQDLDRPCRLLVYAPDGSMLIDRDLTDVIPPRALEVSAASGSGGLSFSADGRQLVFAAQDLDVTFQAIRLVRVEISTNTLTVVRDDLRGTGGSLSPDGRRYLFTRADGDRHDLAELDLDSGAIRTVVTAAPRHYFATPRTSPDGKQIVTTVFDGSRFGISILSAIDGSLRGMVPLGTGPATDASWVDDHRILFLAGSEQTPGFQIYLRDLTAGTTVLVTHAPYLAFEPRAAGNGSTVRFLNREGWRWTLDEVPLPPPPVVPAPPPVVVAAPPAAPPASSADQSAPPPVVVVAPPEAPPPPAPAPPPPVPATPPAPAAPSVAVLPPAVGETPVILDDRPYSGLDHLFVPQLRAVNFQTAGRSGQLYGAVLDGGDRLSLHRWLLFGYLQWQSSSTLGSGGFGYANEQLAPFTLFAFAEQFSWRDTPVQLTGTPTTADFTLTQRQRDVELGIERLFYENPIELSFVLTENEGADSLAVPVLTRRFAGPQLSASFVGVESTPYTDDRRLLGANLSAALFPDQWGTASFTFADLRAQLTATLPLPLSRRHTLHLGLRGRDLAGAPDSAPILQVGGAAGGLIYHRSDRPPGPDFTTDIVPPGISFFEPLRGYEDFAISTDRVAIADATYRYPFIIDWGSASTLWLLPAFFLRQVNLELFYAGAVEGRSATRHEAAGAALGVDFAMLGPWSLQVQIARRLEDDRARTQAVFLSTGW